MTHLKSLLPAALAMSVVCACQLPGSSGAEAATHGESLAAQPFGDGAWRRDAIWDDGLAEYSVYEAQWHHYGQLWTASICLLAVKEPWAPDLEVKADTPREQGFEVIKLNHIRDAETGIYSYHQSAGVFVRRDNGALRKLTTTSSEACGISTATVKDGQLDLRSYHDGQGDRSFPWPAAALPHDGLPLILREYVEGPLPPNLEIYPELMTGRFAEHGTRSFQLTRAQVEELEVPAGRFAAVALTLSNEGKQDLYVFDARSPHTLLLMRASNGTEYRLARTERIAYWGLHNPGDEAWHPARGAGE